MDGCMVLYWLMSLWLHLSSFVRAAVYCLLSAVMLTVVLAVFVVHAAMVLMFWLRDSTSITLSVMSSLVILLKFGVVQSIAGICFESILHFGRVLCRCLCANSCFSIREAHHQLQGVHDWQRVIDEIFDGNALVPFAHGMALISNGIFEEVVIACKGNYYEPPNNNCQTALNKVYVAIDGLNIYDILEPCYHGPTKKKIQIHEMQQGLLLQLLLRVLGALTHTLGTLVPVIGASGFATAATTIGIVVGSFK